MSCQHWNCHLSENTPQPTNMGTKDYNTHSMLCLQSPDYWSHAWTQLPLSYIITLHTLTLCIRSCSVFLQPTYQAFVSGFSFSCICCLTNGTTTGESSSLLDMDLVTKKGWLSIYEHNRVKDIAAEKIY